MRRRIAVSVAVTALVGGLIAAPPVAADIAETQVVSENPVDYTPHVKDGTVRAYAVVGSKVVVGGTFTQVQQAGTKKIFDRTGIFAFDKTTGVIDTAFAPKLLKSTKDANGNFLPGEVYALQPGDNGTVYAAGYYTTVNGATVRSLARLKLADGTNDTNDVQGPAEQQRRRPRADPPGQSPVRGRHVHDRHRRRTPHRDRPAQRDDRRGRPELRHHAGRAAERWGAAGREHRGQPARSQLAMVKVSDTRATLSSWATTRYGNVCNTSAFDTYVRDIDFDPTGTYFVVVSTGGPFGKTTLCDSAARWNATKFGSGQEPVWVNYTGGDTLLSVSCTGVAVYVGGHQRWLDNPDGHDNAGPGAVSRPGIGAIDPTTGKALSWNPTRTRGHGAEVLMATTEGGLFVGSDTDELGGEWHQKVGLFPAP
jgi:hypothetical protein